MNTYPTKQIDGDVSIGGNVSAGGDVNVQGHARISHDLKVEGWLEAKNIKDTLKGLFMKEASLNALYPRPQKGWWALVGKTLPADIYVVEDGKWVPTGEKGGNPDIDCTDYNEAMEQLVADMAQVAEIVDGYNASIANAKENSEDAKATVDNLVASKGKPDGIAPLDAAGKVPARHLPSYVDDVVEFDNLMTGSDGITFGTVADEYKDNDSYMLSDLGVWYYAPERAFCRFTRVYCGSNQAAAYMDPAGEGCGALGDADADGKVCPVAGKIYVCREENESYRWSGSALSRIGHSPVVIGTDQGTAMDGALGHQLMQLVQKVDNAVQSLEVFVKEGGHVLNINTATMQDTAFESWSAALAAVPVEYGAEDYWDQMALWPLPGAEVTALIATSDGNKWQRWRYTPGEADWSEFANPLLWTYVPEGAGGSTTVECPTCATNSTAILNLQNEQTQQNEAIAAAQDAADNAKSAAVAAKGTATAAKTKAENLEETVTTLTEAVNDLKAQTPVAAPDHVDYTDLAECGYTTGSITNYDVDAGALLGSKGSIIVRTLTLTDTRVSGSECKHNHIVLPTATDGIKEGDIVRILDARGPVGSVSEAITIHTTTNDSTAAVKIFGTGTSGGVASFTLKSGYVDLMAYKYCVDGGANSSIDWIAIKKVDF